MDSIIIKDIECWTHIGVPDAERSHEQLVLVTVELGTDTQNVAKSDDVSKGIDYEQVKNLVKKLAQKERKTLEKFVEDIADEVLKECSPKNVKVTAKKTPMSDTEGVYISISRP